MNTAFFANAVRRNLGLVILTALAGLGVALLISIVSQPRYKSEASFIISPNPAAMEDGNDVIQTINTLDKRSTIATFAEVLGSQRIWQETATRAGLDPSILSTYDFNTTVLPQANVVRLTVEGPNRGNVTSLAQAVGENAINYTNEIYSIYRVEFLDTPSVPTSPVSPQPVRDSLMGALLGAALGTVLAAAIQSRREGRAGFNAGMRTADGHERGGSLSMGHFENELARQIKTKRGALSVGLVRLDGLHEHRQNVPPGRMHQIRQLAAQLIRGELLERDLVAQYDQNTYAILLPGMTGPAATEIMRRVQHNLNRPVRYNEDGDMLTLEPRVGVAEHNDGAKGSELMRQAHQALDSAKEQENRLALFASNPSSTIPTRVGPPVPRR